MQKEPSGDRRHKELSGDRSRLIRKFFFGSVPGTQNSYRAEANALLHALTYTNGNASLVLDCKGVIRQYNKGPEPISNMIDYCGPLSFEPSSPGLPEEEALSL